MDVRSPFFQNIALIVAGVMFLNPIVATAAQLTVDAQAGGNTSLDQAGNGVPIVNIATPNGSGLSHNKFTDYNVGQQGLILNNATERLQSTQQGGIIIGNPNLQGRAAGVILNEVTGSNRSQFKGYTEVAGQAAHVIVANPHGITCDGCGFINTPRATLSTGAPVVNNGRLQGFDVNGGDIAIEGAGLNASNVDQFDLITRSAQINAEIHAKRLNVIAGRNEVDVATLQATAKADDGSQQPQLAIDSSALGGMYAGAIRLVGTEAGVGVKLAGDMAASAGDIRIDASGKLSLAQTSAAGDLAVKAGEVALTGKTYAAGQARISAQGSLQVQQSLATAGDIRLEAEQVVNQGLVEAGVKADNSRTAADLRIEAQQIRNTGSLIGNRQLEVKASQRLDNQGGTLSAKTLTRIDAAQLDNRQGQVRSDAALSVVAGDVDNRSGQIAAKQVDIAVAAGGVLDNRQGMLFAQERLEVAAGDLDNSGKGTLASQGSLSVTLSGHLDNHGQGTLVSQGSQSIRAASVDNGGDGLLSSRTSLSLTEAATDNRGGRIQADGVLNLNQGSLNNQGGTLSGKGSVSLELSSLDNRNQGQVSAKGNLDAKIGHLEQANGGELLSQGRLTLEGTRLDNRQGGLIAATEALEIVAGEVLLNTGGEISTPGLAVVRVHAGSGQPGAVLDNSGAGLIVADQGLELYVQRLLNNAKGVLAGRDGLILRGGSLDNSAGGTLTSQRTIGVQLEGTLNNQGHGRILATKGLQIEAASIDNKAVGLLSSGAALGIKGGTLDNQGGRVVSDGQLSIRNSSLNNSKAGSISAGQALSIETGLLDNHGLGGITAVGDLSLDANQLNNHDQGRIAAKGTVQVSAKALDQHDGGELVSESALTLDLQGGDLDNSDNGLIATPGALLLKNLGKVDNSAGGEISSSQGFLLKARELNNSAGRVISAQALQLQITQMLKNSLKGVLSGGSLEVKAASLDNAAAGVLASKGDMEVKLTGKLDNHDQGTLSAAQALTVETAELDNANAGLLASGAELQVTTGALNNQGGSLLSQAGLELASGDLDNRGGVISSRQALDMTAGAVDNRDNGLITSADTLDLTAIRLDSSRDLGNSGGELSAKKDLRLTVTQLIQRQGRLIGEAGVRLDLKGGDLDNRGGLLTANGPLSLQALGKLDNRDGGEVSSTQGYRLLARAIDNGEQGRIISAGQLGLDVGKGSLRNAAGGLISGWQGVQIAAGSLDNSARGTVSSRDGALSVKLDGSQGMLNNSGEGALVSKAALEIEAASLDNSAKGIVSSGGDLDLRLSGALDNSGNGLIDSQGSLTANAGAVNNNAGQIGSGKAASLNATRLDNRAGQLTSGAALGLTLTGDLRNGQQGKLASAGPLVLKAQAIDNQSGSLISQNLLDLTASSLNNAGGTVAARNGLNLLLTGALNNAGGGLIHSQLGAVGIRAQSLDNAVGSLSSQGDLLLTLDGKLDNQGGQLQSRNGNLDLRRSTSVDNRGGVLNSLTGWLKLVSAGLFDNDGGTAQAQALDIEAQGLNNRVGHISALAGNTSIDLGRATFNNQGGGLYAHQLLGLIAGDFHNQGTASGQGGKVAAGRIDFGLSGALNNAYGIVESTSSLSLASTGLDNRNGSLRALGSSGDTRITASSLDNRQGRIETANTNLVLDAASLQSSGGSILHVGTGNFGLSAAQVMGAGGDLSTNGLLSLTADSWTNSGVLQAGRLVLNIGTFTQTTTGQLLASQSLSGSGGTWINDGLLASDGSLSLNLSGAYSGAGQVTSLGELNLKAASLDLASAARISGGAVSTISSTGTLTNHGRLTSAGGLTVSANTLNNYGTLGSSETLRLVAPNLLNERGLIFSGGDMALRVNNFTNKYADVYGLGDLSVSRNDANAQTAILENISGTIESLGDMRLFASRVVNRKDAFKVTERLVSGDITYHCLDCKGRHYDFYYYIEEKLERTVESDSPAANLISGGNLAVSGVDFENSYSQVSAAGNIAVSVADFTNTGASTSSVVRRTQLRNPVDSERNHIFWNMVNPGGAIAEYAKYNSLYLYKYTDEWYDDRYVIPTTVPRGKQRTNRLNPDYNPNVAYPLPARFSSYSVVSATETNTSSGVAANAVIQAGGNVNINASKKLDNGVTRESFDFGAGRSQALDTRVIGTGKTTVVSLNSQLPPNLQQQQVNPLTLPGFTLPQGENGLFRLSHQTALSGRASSVQSVDAGSNQAGSSSLVSVNADQATQVPVTATGSSWRLQDDHVTVSLANVALPQVVGVHSLPGHAAPPARHKYLIETNPALTNLKQFVNSDYLLGKLGYEPDQAQKRLGDGLYEQRLVREAIVARTGQRYLAGLTSDEAMFRYLMDNAIASKDRLGLSLGVTLSAEQVAALTHDIVWLEEHEVAGEKVLVPVLYLAQAKGRLAANGALIQGRDVTLISGGELVNQGTLRASENLTATAGNIRNSGLVEAGNRLQLLATDSIRNAQGGIIAGRDVSLIAREGDIVNERSVTQHAASIGSHRWGQTYVDSAARIEASNSLSLAAGRDVSNLGSVLDSRGDLSIQAGRDVTVASVQEGQYQTRGNWFANERVTQVGAQVSAGRDLDIAAGRDLGVVASRVTAGRDIDLGAERDLVLSSAANESHFLSRSKKVTQSRDQITQQSSEIQAGRDISLGAGNDLSVIASRVQAGNDVNIDASQDINILSAKDESASYYFKKKKGSFGRSSSKQQESYDSTNIASVIEAGNDLTVNTSKAANGALNLDGGPDVTVIGSQLTAGNDLLVGGAGDVAVLSGVEEHGSYSKKTKSGFLGLSKSGKSQLKTSATQVASELEAGNDVVIAAGNDIRLRASTTEAGNDVELRAGLVKDTGDINLVSANDTAYSLTEQYKKKTGLSVSGGMLSVSSAKKAGQEARSSTSVGSHVAAERDASLLAERDINVIGSSVSAGRNLLLDAGRDVNVAAAQNQQGSTSWERERRTGVGLNSDRNGFTAFVGNDVQIEKGLNTRQTAAASSLEAGNDLDVRAGRDANLSGSAFSAGRDINVLAERDINLDAATERYFQEQQELHQRNGLTVNVSHNFGNTVDAIKGVGQGDNLISQVSGVLKAADSVTQFVSGPTTANHLGTTRQQTTTTDGVLSNLPTTMDAGRDVNLQAGNDISAKGSQIQAARDINMSGRDITLDVARGKQTSSTKQVISQSGINGGSTFNSARAGVGGSHGVHREEGAQGTALVTQLQAGRDIHLDASRDLELISTRAEAGRDISLAAGNDIDIRAAQNDSEHEMRRKSGGGEVGLALGGQDFISVYASVDIGKGRLDREAGKQQEAYLYAGKQLSFESGRDTTVAGARLEGQDVVGKVGRDLLVSSAPDTGKVSGKELDASLTVSVGMYGSVSVSGSVGVGKTNGSTNWVENQTGIVAHDRLDIRTENHTQLDGALLASDSGNLNLDTGTFGFRDIEGHDREHAWYINAGGTYSWGSDSGSGGEPADGNAAATSAVVDPSQQNKDGSNNWNLSGYDYRMEREQIVRATVGEGEIVVRSDADTGHDSTAGLNRDVSKAYEVTKDKEERTNLYISKSSVEAVSDPVVTLDQWKSGAENYGRNSVEAFSNLAALKEHARSAAEHDKLVAALAWAPELLVGAMDAMGTPTLGIFPGTANHGGLITQLPVLISGDLRPLRVTGAFKTDAEGELVLEKGKPVLDSESLQVQQFAGFNEEEDRIFTNGIMNSMIEALSNGFMQSGSGNGDVSFVLAYNPTHGLIGDLIESAFDKNLQGAIRSGTARNLNGLFQQGIDAGPDSLHIYGHSQGGLLTWVAMKGLDFSNGGSPTATLNTIQLSGAPVDAIQFHKDAETAGFGRGQSVFQVNRPEETVFFGLLPKTDTVSDLPLFLGGNAQYSDDPVARTLGALFSVTSLFGERSPHSNYACVSCKPSAPDSADAQIRDIIIKPTLIDSQGDFRRLE
ncbi:hemagglutinin repeat-containing protein [Pseudomonas sp. URMO17WK12:I2]|uniref:hemagglutinin repeat-containing protein n=1 Tax=Pseudomonas sp. URMO17WK12:I2 TaxID=1261623 RepID=UPI000DAD233D|nr:hemagglutinin repeat-containing protein [Pseudomonas sp. URMO17WK12:I2]PZW49455.1 filamentous hemagglutinin [Pseudomonas sp. URMO17WK12:I2]